MDSCPCRSSSLLFFFLHLRSIPLSSIPLIPFPLCPCPVPVCLHPNPARGFMGALWASRQSGHSQNDKRFLVYSGLKITLPWTAQLQKFSDNQITKFAENQGWFPLSRSPPQLPVTLLHLHCDPYWPCDTQWHRYGICQTRSDAMVSSQPRRCWWGISSHNVPPCF